MKNRTGLKFIIGVLLVYTAGLLSSQDFTLGVLLYAFSVWFLAVYWTKSLVQYFSEDLGNTYLEKQKEYLADCLSSNFLSIARMAAGTLQESQFIFVNSNANEYELKVFYYDSDISKQKLALRATLKVGTRNWKVFFGNSDINLVGVISSSQEEVNYICETLYFLTEKEHGIAQE